MKTRPIRKWEKKNPRYQGGRAEGAGPELPGRSRARGTAVRAVVLAAHPLRSGSRYPRLPSFSRPRRRAQRCSCSLLGILG